MRIIIDTTLVDGDSFVDELEMLAVTAKSHPSKDDYIVPDLGTGVKDLAAQRLSRAVQIPTITYDRMEKPGEDPRWEIFYVFNRYLLKTFPRV
jgi:hypothetical protein